jgi:hypothetical protein
MAGAMVVILMIHGPASIQAQKARTPSARNKLEQKSARDTAREQLLKSKDDLMKAAQEYKKSLEQLISLYEAGVRRASAELDKQKELYNEGLVSKREVSASEQKLTALRAQVDDAHRRMKVADDLIAQTLVEVETDEQANKLATTTTSRGQLIRTVAYIRYKGASTWSLTDAWRVQQFFANNFKRPLPIGAFGQSALHDRWCLDHHNALDVGLNPDSLEGQSLMNFLERSKIPFTAFRYAVNNSATGPHIHIGVPSRRTCSSK